MDKLPVDKLEELKQLEMLKEDCEFAIKCDRYIPRVDTLAIKALIDDAISQKSVTDVEVGSIIEWLSDGKFETTIGGTNIMQMQSIVKIQKGCVMFASPPVSRISRYS